MVLRFWLMILRLWFMVMRLRLMVFRFRFMVLRYWLMILGFWLMVLRLRLMILMGFRIMVMIYGMIGFWIAISGRIILKDRLNEGPKIVELNCML